MNPFELRTKLLEMATDHLRRQHEINCDFAKESFSQMIKTGQAIQQDYQKYMPKMYTFDDVVNEAQKLYGFVNNAK
jgi:hypothetical protein